MYIYHPSGCDDVIDDFLSENRGPVIVHLRDYPMVYPVI